MTGLSLSGLGDLATWASLLVTLLGAIAAGLAFWWLRRRERRQALTDLHASLTSGETAHARHIMGTLLYADPQDRPAKLDSIAAYFALIWALQRARNVFRTFGMHWRELNQPQTRLSALSATGRKDASIALTWNLTEIAENILRFRAEYKTIWNVEDGDAWADVGAYITGERIGAEKMTTSSHRYRDRDG